ncbi:hypothetical protein Tco_0765443 [Tanacetum coccineum]
MECTTSNHFLLLLLVFAYPQKKLMNNLEAQAESITARLAAARAAIEAQAAAMAAAAPPREWIDPTTGEEEAATGE